MKSGGNEFSGSLDVRYQADAFQESGDHFDPDSQEQFTTSPSRPPSAGPSCATGCGSSRPSTRASREITPEGAPTTWKGKVNSPKAKLTWQISPRGGGSPRPTLGDTRPSRTSTPHAGPCPKPPVSTRQSEPDYLSLGIDGMFSEPAVEPPRRLQPSAPTTSRPMSGDLETIAHFNRVTQILSANFHRQEHNASETPPGGDRSHLVSLRPRRFARAQGRTRSVGHLSRTNSCCNTGNRRRGRAAPRESTATFSTTFDVMGQDFPMAG